MRNNIKTKRWSYLAGLVDGDGSISLTEYESPRQVHFFFSVKVTSTQRPQINWLIQQFGGEMRKDIDKRDRNKPCFTWKVKGIHAKNILEGMLPFMVLKKMAAIKGLEYVNIPFGSENPILRSQYAKEICDFNTFYVPSQDLPWLPLIFKPSSLSKDEIAYAAGLLDAEGTFSSPTPKAKSPQIQLSNTDARALEWFYYRFGGIVFSSKKANQEHRDAGLWRFSGGRCQKKVNLDQVKKCKELFLLAILPYLIQKRKQAILSLQLLRGEIDAKFCYDELKKLNYVGTPTTNTPNSPENGLKIEPDPVSDYGYAPAVMLEV